MPFDPVATPLLPGTSLVEASAGTGKTYAMSRLVPRLLLDGTVNRASELLLVTFTNDATRELADRVRRTLETLAAPPTADEPKSDPALHALRTSYPHTVTTTISRALLEIDQLSICTIHSFCLQVLQQEGTLCDLPTVPELVTDTSQALDHELYCVWRSLLDQHPLLSAIAVQMGWTAQPTSEIAQLLLRETSITPRPAPIPDLIPHLTRLLHTAFQNCSPHVLAQAQTLFNDLKPDHCNQDCPPLNQIAHALAALSHPPDPAQPWIALNALLLFAHAPSWIHGNRARKLKQACAQLTLVTIAQDLTTQLKDCKWQWHLLVAQHLSTAYEKRLQTDRTISYDQIITTVFRALCPPANDPIALQRAAQLKLQLRTRWKVALIDESQDTDSRQLDIFTQLFATAPQHLLLIGDPKQAIYGFRGADLSCYLRARNTIAQNPLRHFTLNTTYRQPEPLVQAINRLFSRPLAFHDPALSFTPATSGIHGTHELFEPAASPPLEWWLVPDDDCDDFSNEHKRLTAIADAIASHIVRLLHSGAFLRRSQPDLPPSERPITPGDIAILVANHREARAMLRALETRRVPAIRARSGNVLASDEATDLLHLLMACHFPRESKRRLTALATRLFGLTLAQIAFVRNDPTQDDQWLADFQAAQTEWLRNGFDSAFAYLDSRHHLTQRLATAPQGERRVTNLRHLLDLLAHAAQQEAPDPERLVHWFQQRIASCNDDTQEEHLQRLESDAQAVQIVTMHASKGLEYPLVFCAALWRPFRSDHSKRPLLQVRDPQGSLHLADPHLLPPQDPLWLQATTAQLEEQLRLAYVALTRAQVKAWVIAGAVAGKKPDGCSALDWLLRHDQDTLETLLQLDTPRGSAHSRALATLYPTPDEAVIKPFPPNSNATLNTPLAHSTTPLEPLPAPIVPLPWLLTSFSALTRDLHPHGTPTPPLVKPAALNDNSLTPFAAAPAGALLGTALHTWLETWDFSPLDSQSLPKLQQTLAAFELDPASLLPATAAMLSDLRLSLLSPWQQPLHTVAAETRASEWHFYLPLRSGLSAQHLARAFAQHGESGYAPFVAALNGVQLGGFLHGFIDRLVSSGNEWGVVDWKSNHLGNTAADYATDSLLANAYHHHYVLQAHLYLIALRRFLRDRHKVRGAWLVYLRGVQAGTARGILTISPSTELLDALDNLFAAPSFSPYDKT